MQFEFATAGRILFGPGTLARLGPMAREMGSRALVVLGIRANRPDDSNRAAPLFDILNQAGVGTVLMPVGIEPTVELVRQGVALARKEQCDLIVGFGGGSTIDTAKAIAALYTNPGEVLDYLEVIGKGLALTQASLPVIAVPTTAGTGAEVTRNAVLGSPEHKLKVSLRSPWMLPRLALVDPELTYTLPPDVTASTGMDALTQLIEPYVSNKANPITDGFCIQGIPRAAGALLRAFRDGSDKVARQDMSLASLLGGLALANAKLGVVHGFASVLGGRYSAPHGAICARLLPNTMEANLHALRLRQPDSPVIERYRQIAQLLTGQENAQPEDGVTWVQEMVGHLQIPPLSAYGITPSHFPDLIHDTSKASSTQGNPIPLTTEELEAILTQSL